MLNINEFRVFIRINKYLRKVSLFDCSADEKSKMLSKRSETRLRKFSKIDTVEDNLDDLFFTNDLINETLNSKCSPQQEFKQLLNLLREKLTFAPIKKDHTTCTEIQGNFRNCLPAKTSNFHFRFSYLGDSL